MIGLNFKFKKVIMLFPMQSRFLATSLILILGSITWAMEPLHEVTLKARLEGLVKNQKLAEALYDDIVKADRTGILVLINKDSIYAQIKYRHFVEELEHRVKRLNNGDKNPPSIGELGLAMLVPLDPRMKNLNLVNWTLRPSPDPDRDWAYRAIHQSFKVIGNEPEQRRAALRTLLLEWMNARLGVGVNEYTFMARQYKLIEAAPELLKVALNPMSDPGIRYFCLESLTDLAGKKEAEALAALLNLQEKVPERLTSLQSDRSPQQWRDVVLGVLIRQAQEKTADYGFLLANDGKMPTRAIDDFVFADDKARQMALAKWKSRVEKR